MDLGAAYIAELSQAESRGFFTGLTGVATALGYTSAALVGLGFSYTSDAAVQWRTPLGISLVPVAIQVVGLFFIPESPRHLLLKNQTEKAWDVISHIHYDATDTDQAFVKEEFFQMQKQIEFDQTLDGSWTQLFRKPSYRKRMLMAAFLQFLGQSTAVLVVANYVCHQTLLSLRTTTYIPRALPCMLLWASTRKKHSSCNVAGLQVRRHLDLPFMAC